MNKLALKALRDIRVQRRQYLALVVIILLGVTGYGAMIGMIDDVLQSIEHTLSQLRFADLTVGLEGDVSQAVITDVASLSNVEAVSGRLVMDTGLVLSEGRANARLIGSPSGEQPDVNQLYITQGRYLRPGDRMAAVLDHHLADYYGLQPGDSVHPIVDGQPVAVQIVGIGISPEYLMAVASAENPLPAPSSFGVLFMPEAELERLMAVEGTVNELGILLRDHSQSAMDALVVQIAAIVGDDHLGAVTPRADNPSYSLLKLDLEGGREMMQVVPTMFLLVAALSIYVFLSRLVQAQQPEIGVIRAQGYARRRVLTHYLLYAGVVAVLGAVLGLVLSYPLGLAFTRAYAAEFGLPFVLARFHTGSALQAVGVTLLACLVAGFFPALRSTRVSPAQAMRYDPSVSLVRGSVPLLEKGLGALVPLSTSARITLRNLFRNRRRTVTTGLGFAFAVVVLLACWSLFDALGHMLDLQFRRTDLWDLHATFSRPQTAAVLQEMRGWDGVQIVEPAIELPATLEAGAVREHTIVTGLSSGTALHRFQLREARSAEQVLLPGQVLLSRAMGERLGVETGDWIEAQTPLGSARVRADVSNEEVLSGQAYVQLEWLQAEAGGLKIFNSVLLTVDAAYRSRVRDQLYDLPGAASVSLKDEIVAGWRSLMGLYYVMMGTFLIFALVMAGAVIYNTMTVNVLERQREIATMRALGQSRGRMGRMISLENVAIGLMALVPGLALATVVTYYLFQVFSQMSLEFRLPYYVAPRSYAIVTLLVFTTAMLAQIPAIRRLNRMDLAEATKVLT